MNTLFKKANKRLSELVQTAWSWSVCVYPFHSFSKARGEDFLPSGVEFSSATCGSIPSPEPFLNTFRADTVSVLSAVWVLFVAAVLRPLLPLQYRDSPPPGLQVSRRGLRGTHPAPSRPWVPGSRAHTPLSLFAGKASKPLETSLPAPHLQAHTPSSSLSVPAVLTGNPWAPPPTGLLWRGGGVRWWCKQQGR